MNRLKSIILIVITLLIFSSCAYQKTGARAPKVSKEARQKRAETKASFSEADKTNVAASTADETALEKRRKIIRTAKVSLYVEDFEKTRNRIEDITRQFNGYVANKSKQKSGNTIWGEVEVWVPADKLLQFTDEVSKTGKVRNSNITAQDISDRYYDLQARLKNAKIQEQRLRELLQNKAGNIDQILKVEKELARVRGEIEVMEGRKRQWDKQVALSTVTIHLTQDIRAATEPDDIWKPLRQAFRNAKPVFVSSIGAIVSFFSSLFIIIIALIPWVPVVWLIVWLFKKYGQKLMFWKKKEKHETKDEKQPDEGGEEKQ